MKTIMTKAAATPACWPLMGKESPFEAIAEAAGLVNVCDAANYSAISKEKVVGEWKPDLLVVPAITYTADFSVVDDQGAALIAAIKADKLLSDPAGRPERPDLRPDRKIPRLDIAVYGRRGCRTGGKGLSGTFQIKTQAVPTAGKGTSMTTYPD